MGRLKQNKDENQKLIDDSKPFIDITLSDQLLMYGNYINSINNIAYSSESFRILPVLNRNLLENLLRDIFSSSLMGDYNYLYYNKDRGRIRNFSTLLDVFNKLRKYFEEFYAINISDNIINYLEKFRKEGNYSSHELETHIDLDYANEIKGKFSATLRVLFQLYHKIINSDKKIEKIDEKLQKVHVRDKKLKNIDTKKILNLISLIRNDIVNINYDEIEEQTSITHNEIERIQEKINELYVSITRSNLNIESANIIRYITKLELKLHSRFPYQPSLKHYIELISIYFKIALISLSENDVLIVKQALRIKNLKITIIILIIGFLTVFLLFILRELKLSL